MFVLYHLQWTLNSPPGSRLTEVVSNSAEDICSSPGARWWVWRGAEDICSSPGARWWVWRGAEDLCSSPGARWWVWPGAGDREQLFEGSENVPFLSREANEWEEALWDSWLSDVWLLIDSISPHCSRCCVFPIRAHSWIWLSCTSMSWKWKSVDWLQTLAKAVEYTAAE